MLANAPWPLIALRMGLDLVLRRPIQTARLLALTLDGALLCLKVVRPRLTRKTGTTSPHWKWYKSELVTNPPGIYSRRQTIWRARCSAHRRHTASTKSAPAANAHIFLPRVEWEHDHETAGIGKIELSASMWKLPLSDGKNANYRTTDCKTRMD